MFRVYCSGWSSGEPYTTFTEFETREEASSEHFKESEFGKDPDGNWWQTVDLLEVLATSNRLVND